MGATALPQATTAELIVTDLIGLEQPARTHARTHTHRDVHLLPKFFNPVYPGPNTGTSFSFDSYEWKWEGNASQIETGLGMTSHTVYTCKMLHSPILIFMSISSSVMVASVWEWGQTLHVLAQPSPTHPAHSRTHTPSPQHHPLAPPTFVMLAMLIPQCAKCCPR